MKHFLAAAVLALPLSVCAEKEAHAWAKFNFGVGANISYQTGGNKSLLWGAWTTNDCAQQNCMGQAAPGCMGGFGPAMPAMQPQPFDQGPMPQFTPEPATAKPAGYQELNQGEFFVPVSYDYADPNFYMPAPWFDFGN